jgi:hypothetical protein
LSQQNCSIVRRSLGLNSSFIGTQQQARKLLRSVDEAHVAGLRERAVLGVLAYPCLPIIALAA